MRRGGAAGTFGLSFLDLISCAFAGVLVLYLLAEPKRHPIPSNVAFVQIEAASSKTPMLGAEIVAGGTSFKSWAPGERGVQWVGSPGSLLALVTLSDPGDVSLQILVVKPGESDPVDTTYKLQVTTPVGSGRTLELTHDSMFRSELLEDLEL